MLQSKVVEKIKTHNFKVNNFFFEKSAIYVIVWKSTVQSGRSQMTILCMRIGRWIPKATNTESECLIVIAFPQQQWLHKRASTLR
jgi:hypothetical protein